MEDVLHQYAQPYDPRRPVVCFDERPCFLIGDLIAPLPLAAGQPKREDYHYSKHGSCALLMAFEPLTGRRWARVYAQRTAAQYTDFMQHLTAQFPEAERIVLIQDNLNTHQPGSFYAHLPPQEAFDLAHRFEWHFTPTGASWLNMIELEFAVLSKQCLDRRIPTQAQLTHEVMAWVEARNRQRATVHWQFSVHDARQTFQRRYPSSSA